MAALIPDAVVEDSVEEGELVKEEEGDVDD